MSTGESIKRFDSAGATATEQRNSVTSGGDRMDSSQQSLTVARWRQRLRHGLALSVAAFLLLVAVGCGGDLAEVTGVVTIDGKPLRGGEGMHATVFFQPVAGQGANAAGILNENGVYRLSTGSQQGVAPGEYVATCSASEIIPSTTPGGTPSGRRVTDPKYASVKTSDLRFTIEPGKNQCDIALESPSASSGRH